MKAELREALAKIVREQADKGNIIEMCWQLFARQVKVPPGGTQWIEMRRAFFGGANLLLEAQTVIYEEGDEPTENDLARMDSIGKELQRYAEDLRAGRA